MKTLLVIQQTETSLLTQRMMLGMGQRRDHKSGDQYSRQSKRYRRWTIVTPCRRRKWHGTGSAGACNGRWSAERH
jgi:hypothetical protein